jgi:diguanylate cyclase (GGDEF)-like protein
VIDLRSETRFPQFSPRASADRLAAVFTFPMRLDGDRLGALDLYRDTPGGLSKADLKAAQVLADVAAAYLFNAQARIDASATLARLDHRSLHDPLTGLPNRTLLDKAVAWARRSHLIAAVLSADLDGFKAVNDRYGHHVGDQLLGAVAARLTEVVRPGDTVARLGGDEFVVLCEDLHDAGDAETVARRLTTAVSAPFDLAGHQIAASVSVGIAFSGPGEGIPEELLRGLRDVPGQQDGGGRHAVIDPAARIAADRRDELERDLAQAQHRAQLALVYQPIIDVRSGDLVAVEALLRWYHPERGTVMPGTVIPSAERTGLILAIGEWVLSQACRDLQVWQTHRLAVPSVAVNVSAHQVMGPAFPRTVARVLADTGADPGAVTPEVTEGVFLTDAPRALAVLRAVKDLGVALSLDDFGTGYSSLVHLKRLPVSEIKVDRSFVQRMTTDADDAAIVRSIVDLAHSLGLRVVAEGVETAETWRALEALGCDLAQGYLISRPVPGDEVTRWLSAHFGPHSRRPAAADAALLATLARP